MGVLKFLSVEKENKSGEPFWDVRENLKEHTGNVRRTGIESLFARYWLAKAVSDFQKNSKIKQILNVAAKLT